MCVDQLEKLYSKYDINKCMLIFQFVLVPFIIYGVIYLLGFINIRYTPFYHNSTIPVFTNGTLNYDLWKIGIEINVSTVLVFLYFIIYLFLDFLTALIFLIECLFICFISNVIRFSAEYYGELWICILVVSVLCFFIYGIVFYCCMKEPDSIRRYSYCNYCPSILVLLPFFTIFNVLRSCCRYRNSNTRGFHIHRDRNNVNFI